MLAAQIKAVNSLKAQDLKAKDEFINTKLRDDQHTEENTKENAADCYTNREENNRKIQLIENATTNCEIVHSETCEEIGERSTPQPALKPDICGNTEVRLVFEKSTKKR